MNRLAVRYTRTETVQTHLDILIDDLLPESTNRPSEPFDQPIVRRIPERKTISATTSSETKDHR